jgi:hypothetical protein
MSKFWQFALAGVVVGLIMGWGVSLVSGNLFVVAFFGAIGTVVGIVLGIVHRND